MAAPTRARGCSFSCQGIFKFTLLFGVVVIAGLVVTGFIELRDLQDRLGWTPSDKQLLCREHIVARTGQNIEERESGFRTQVSETRRTTENYYC